MKTIGYFAVLGVLILGGTSIVKSSSLASPKPNDSNDPSTPLAPMELAVTLDDIPGHEPDLPYLSRKQALSDIIQVLKKHHVPGVYGFVNGDALLTKPSEIDILQLWLDSGYALGNHTFHHMSLTKNTAEQFIADIELTDNLLASLTLSPESRRVFRFPYLQEGDTLAKRDAIRNYLFNRGYLIAPVTVDYDDWAWNYAYMQCREKNENATIDQIKKNLLDNAGRSVRHAQQLAQTVFGRDIKHVLLLHHTAIDGQTLDAVLTQYEADGVKFIPFLDAIKDPVYTINPNQASADTGDFTEQVASVKGIDDPNPDNKYDSDKVQEICKSPVK